MACLDDMNEALKIYPVRNMTIELINEAFTGNAINVLAQGAKTLIKATLEGWNANTDHIFRGHSDPLPEPKGIFEAAIVAA